MRGWRLLIALAVIFWVAFAVQRARSPFLRIASEPAIAERIAQASGLSTEEVMALRELCGVQLDEARLAAIARQLVQLRREYPSELLAVLAACGESATVAEAMADVDGDWRAAEHDLRRSPEGLVAVRFAKMVSRFRSGRTPGIR